MYFTSDDNLNNYLSLYGINKMMCKDNQNMIDALLRLKDTKTTKEDEVVNLIGSIMNANQTQNKVASVQSTPKRGEVVEFQSLLRLIY